MVLEPQKFRLALERPSQPGDLKPGAEVVCIITALESFTPQVQENIKFSISRWEPGVAGKIPVAIRQDLCCLSEDLRYFRIGFNLVAPGPYRVMVRLGQGHIAESPLKFTAHGSDSSKVDGEGDACGSATKLADGDRGDIPGEILEKRAVHDHDMVRNGVLTENCPRKDFENNIRTKSTKEVTSSDVWVAHQPEQQDVGIVVNSSTSNASKTVHLLTPSNIEGKSDPTDLIDFSSPHQSTVTFFKTPEQSFESLEVDTEPSFEEMPSFDLGQSCQGDSGESKVKEGESIWGRAADLRETEELMQPKIIDGNGNRVCVVGKKMESEIQSLELEEGDFTNEVEGRGGVNDAESQEENQKQKSKEDERVQVNQEVEQEPSKYGQKGTGIQKEECDVQLAKHFANAGEKDRVYLSNLMKEWRVVSELEATPLTISLLEQEIERVGKILTQADLNSNWPISHDLESDEDRAPAIDVENAGEKKVPSILEGAKRVFSIPMCRNPGGKNPDQSLMAPIGFCILQNRNIAVASTFDHKVKLFNSKGNFIAEVKAKEGDFQRPTDMFTLSSGDFLVRDNTRLMLFSGRENSATQQGNFIAVLCEETASSKCSGLAEDEEGRVATIKEGKGEAIELLFFDLKSKSVTRRLDIGHALTDRTNSKCRFLAIKRGKFYISDLGLHHIYVMDSTSGLLLLKVGKFGSEAGCLDNPAGLAVDDHGNMLVADSKNHRISVFSSKGDFIGISKLPEIRRPSSLLLEPNTTQLFVLNLAGYTALVKYRLGSS